MFVILTIIFLFITNCVTLSFLSKRIIENCVLKAKIKRYEEEIFISRKDIAGNKDFYEALSSLDDEFPG